jgi:serine/threonine-protein kinase RsbW
MAHTDTHPPVPIGDIDRDSIYSTFQIPSDRGAVREIRRRVMDFARQLPFAKGDLNSIELAVGEAAVNAVRHGSPLGSTDQVSITCEYHCGRLTIQISDQGSGFDTDRMSCPLPENLSSNGYGLCLMNGLMDEVAFTSGPEGGTTVRMCKHVPRPDC